MSTTLRLFLIAAICNFSVHAAPGTCAERAGGINANCATATTSEECTTASNAENDIANGCFFTADAAAACTNTDGLTAEGGGDGCSCGTDAVIVAAGEFCDTTLQATGTKLTSGRCDGAKADGTTAADAICSCGTNDVVVAADQFCTVVVDKTGTMSATAGVASTNTDGLSGTCAERAGGINANCAAATTSEECTTASTVNTCGVKSGGTNTNCETATTSAECATASTADGQCEPGNACVYAAESDAANECVFTADDDAGAGTCAVRAGGTNENCETATTSAECTDASTDAYGNTDTANECFFAAAAACTNTDGLTAEGGGDGCSCGTNAVIVAAGEFCDTTLQATGTKLTTARCDGAQADGTTAADAICSCGTDNLQVAADQFCTVGVDKTGTMSATARVACTNPDGLGCTCAVKAGGRNENCAFATTSEDCTDASTDAYGNTDIANGCFFTAAAVACTNTDGLTAAAGNGCSCGTDAVFVMNVEFCDTTLEATGTTLTTARCDGAKADGTTAAGAICSCGTNDLQVAADQFCTVGVDKTGTMSTTAVEAGGDTTEVTADEKAVDCTGTGAIECSKCACMQTPASPCSTEDSTWCISNLATGNNCMQYIACPQPPAAPGAVAQTKTLTITMNLDGVDLSTLDAEGFAAIEKATEDMAAAQGIDMKDVSEIIYKQNGKVVKAPTASTRNRRASGDITMEFVFKAGAVVDVDVLVKKLATAIEKNEVKFSVTIGGTKIEAKGFAAAAVDVKSGIVKSGASTTGIATGLIAMLATVAAYPVLF